MEILIREIQPEDYGEVLPLWNNELGNRWATAENMAQTYAQMAADESYKTYVAVCGGRLAGLITVVQVLAVGFPHGYIKINGLAVRQEFRGMGAGRRLVERIEQLARECGVNCVGLATGFKRVEAHAFYEHLGYESGSYYFSKMLE